MDLQKLKTMADEAYFNSSSPIMTDEAYDGLCQHLEDSSIGCMPPSSNKIKLPIFMGSLTKYNDDEKLTHFLNKFNHVNSFLVQEKLDGVSCLYVYDNSKIRLYTRGNGTIGTDITHLIDHGLILPRIRSNSNFMVRGELIISKAIFKEKYSTDFKNIRNMVSGQVTKKNPDREKISDVDFVAYEVIEPSKKFQKSIVDQYHFLEECKFKVVYHRVLKKESIDQEILMDYLNRRKKKSEYEMDGLVVTVIEKYERDGSDNPKYAFAFKIQGETAEVIVDHVKWNLSKSGKYKPQIFIGRHSSKKGVELSGVTIVSLTGFNAKYIVENKIVPGSKLLITRSGDVIPHIVAVLEEGHGPLNLPKNSRWNSVDLYHTFEDEPDEVIIKQMVHFFTKINCTNCKDKTIFKIYNAGFHTIESVIEARVEDFSKIDGFGVKLAAKIHSSIQENVKAANVHELLAALNVFGEGIGLRKIQNIDLSNPENLNVKGLSEATIKEKILPVWKASLDRVKKIKEMVGSNVEEPKKIESGSNPLQDRIFVFTGFRDAILEKKIFELGGKVTSAISKKTTDLVLATEDVVKTSSKLAKARDSGVTIIFKKNLIHLLDKLNHEMKQSIVEIDYDHYSSDEE